MTIGVKMSYYHSLSEAFESFYYYHNQSIASDDDADIILRLHDFDKKP